MRQALALTSIVLLFSGSFIAYGQGDEGEIRTEIVPADADRAFSG
jgi:hypothetical protein